MHDLVDLVVNGNASSAGEATLTRAIAEHVAQLKASAGRGDRRVVSVAEKAVKSDPSRISFDRAGVATLLVDEHRWSAGRFETPAIGELRQRCLARRQQAPTSGRMRFWVLDGASPATDIGSLQASSGKETLFQAASQFNCLESPGPHLVEVARYLSDPTQGPRASVSAFPATLLRHYAAPDGAGGRFVQGTAGRQIDLLAGAVGAGVVQSGYYTGDGRDPQAQVATLADNFEAIRVGVHDEVEVVYGYNWDGAIDPAAAGVRIAQVFTSTVAGGMYGGEAAFGKFFADACRQLLRAAYLGTLLAAVSLGRKRVVLTLIGGGVFGNPIGVILESIEWAMAATEPLLSGDLDVVLNGYALGRTNEVLPMVRRRGGAIVQLNAAGLQGVLR